MKIAIIAGSAWARSEQFQTREILALRDLGHAVTLLTLYGQADPHDEAPEGVAVAPLSDDALRAAAPDVLYGQLGLMAHKATMMHSLLMERPYVLRLWQGYDMFVRPSLSVYFAAGADRHCLGVIVEDQFSRSYAADNMGIDPTKLHVVPNSIDLERYHPRTERPDGPPVVLGVGRFCEKKGFQHLIPAFRALDHPTAILRIVGYGPLESQLRALAANHPRIEFLGAVPESALPDLYRSADVFVAPCVRGGDGDSDGVPTVVLEAMASGLAVIASDLLSMSEYIRDGVSGLLCEPGDEVAIHGGIDAILDGHESELGESARAFAEDYLDIRKNIRRIEAVLAGGGQ